MYCSACNEINGIMRLEALHAFFWRDGFQTWVNCVVQLFWTRVIHDDNGAPTEQCHVTKFLAGESSFRCWNSSTDVSKLKQNNLLLLRMVECSVEVLSYYKLTISVTDTDVQSVQLNITALKLPWIPKVDLSKSCAHNILRQSSSFSKKSTLQTLNLAVLYILVWG
jgi:hypothetical protein